MIDDEREDACDAPVLPGSMAEEVDGYAWARDTVGQSGGAVYRLYAHPTASDLFLKHGTGSAADDVTDEMARLLWLSGRLPVPAVRHFVRTQQAAWLLTTALPGRTAYQLLLAGSDPFPIVDAISAFLRQLHAIPVDDCPFISGHAVRMADARTRINAGLVDVDDFDDVRQGWSAEQVWTTLQALLPLDPDPVVTHGDFSLDNILVDNGAVVGCIDVGRVGVADRYPDLAILWHSLGEFGPALQDRMFARYGIGEPDRNKLDFHLMLDELF